MAKRRPKKELKSFRNVELRKEDCVVPIRTQEIGTCNSGASCEFSYDVPKSRGDSQPSGGQPPGKEKGKDKKSSGPQTPSAGMAAAVAGATGAATADGLRAPETAPNADNKGAGIKHFPRRQRLFAQG